MTAPREGDPLRDGMTASKEANENREAIADIADLIIGTEWDPADVPDATVASEPFDAAAGTVGDYRSHEHAAGWAAWQVLTHDKGYASQIAALYELAHSGPDVWGFVWNAVTEAGRLGYLFAQLPVPDTLTIDQAARMLAAFGGHRILPDPVEEERAADAA
jgi:hypothetical protein